MLTNRRSTMMVPPNRLPSWHPHSKAAAPHVASPAPLTSEAEAPQSRTQALLTSTSPTLAGYRIISVVGAVHGTTSVTRKDSKSFIKNIASNFSSSWGEAKTITSIIYQARDQAVERLINEAMNKGANAVVGLETRESEVLGCIVVSVSGTAVYVEKESATKRDSAQEANPFR
ncbi:hypothetical protein COCC4DRAFT_69820 [Bipolaris maydis ATCC 48331]|uniref:Uncharacterized protein n=3 Tax=Cochliobolus heterostrophus TaxID=5016 RepID=M2UXE4_COCH5|nr:uncharacterized protein COCC4DRAFT_69820 [Bipolaris maydis ATCC 48331]EMD92462.1 hypothetical protein COCHEDRAFT_1203426 [Bipolaris maydis C5]KAH7552889.1 hypothetical protein BM1_07862 [Bipolaris maydis]ENI08156.1 hypothetical protein COCC4DRAFT_69820 [Bipolaris maydis ATCC 48331]KAJ5060982.1 hypothetical protein J3E74DRAFT_242953 [Bipolaris maydis]KAJ6210249.1 hypothetical protein PSV09DRAFT_1203426 [Bipolaris maydis]